MDAAHGAAAPALSKLSSGIREYSLFQGVLRVLDRLRAAHPELDEEALYERLEFQANPSLGFPGSDTDRLEFFEEHGELRARLRINLDPEEHVGNLSIAERQMVELMLRNMRTGMQYAMGEALMRQRENEIAAWAGGDPTRWLEVPPQGYRGECSVEERRNLPEGAWCFERDSRQLVYRPRNAKQLRDPGDGQACNQLAWRVVRVADGVVSGGFVGVRIEPASICRWFLEGVEKAGK